MSHKDGMTGVSIMRNSHPCRYYIKISQKHQPRLHFNHERHYVFFGARVHVRLILRRRPRGISRALIAKYLVCVWRKKTFLEQWRKLYCEREFCFGILSNQLWV